MQVWSIPAALLTLCALFLLWSSGQREVRARAENVGAARVVAIVNEQRTAQLEAALAAMQAQRNAAWQMEELSRQKMERLNAQIDEIAARNPVLDEPVPVDILCLANAALDLERHDPVRDCATLAALPPADDKPGGDSVAAMAGGAGPQR